MKVIFLRDLPRQGPKISYWILHASDSIFRQSKVHTVWKFHDLSITQILREIDFYEFLRFLKAANYQSS